MFSHTVIQAIKKDAIKQYPKESCGFIVNDVYYPCENISESPQESFEISPKEWVKAKKKGKIQAIIHSHPDGPAYPSKNDMVGQIDSNVNWGIVQTNGETAKDPVWFGDCVLDLPLLGRPFVHAVTDCYSAVRSWMWQNKQVKLPEFARHDEWWLNDENMYDESFKSVGYIEISKSEMQFGDSVLMKIRSQVNNHAAVYLGNGLIYHHLYGQLSRREPIERWLKYITKYVRYTGNDA